MLNIRFVAMFFGISMLLPSTAALHAQAADTIPTAPLPSQILAAKKVFISNARGEWNPIRWSGKPERTYNEFYAAIKSWGRFEIVAAPADADLVLQITFVEPIADNGGDQMSMPVFRLVLLDPKTSIVLWTLDEHLPVDAKQKNRDKKFDDAINSLVGYLKDLTIQPDVKSEAK